MSLQSSKKSDSSRDFKDPRYIPAYGLSEAAQYLRIPLATLRSWIRGRSYPAGGTKKQFVPLIHLTKSSATSLSFMNLVEAHVLDAIRREHKIPMHKVRKALAYVKKHFNLEYPLAEQQFETDGLNLFIEDLTKTVSISEAGQLAMREMIQSYLKRIERDRKGLPIKLYPFTRKRSSDLDEPKLVVIDPAVSFGRPVIMGTGIPTNIIAERYKAGESNDELAKDYGCNRTQIEEAIRCELEIAA